MLYLLAAFVVAYVMAHSIPANILARLRTMVPVPVVNQAEQPPREEHQPQHLGTHNDHGVYDPSPIDVAVVRIMLMRATKMPPDLVDSIFETAQYWVRTRTAVDFGAGNARYISVRGGSDTEDEFMLRSLPIGLVNEHGGSLDLTGEPAPPVELGEEFSAKAFAKLADYPTPRLASPVRKLVFNILAHDQGWGGEGGDNEYDNSWTWFEAGLERLDAKATSSQTGEAAMLRHEALRPIHPDIELLIPPGSNARDQQDGFEEFVQQLRASTGEQSGANSQATTPTATTPAATQEPENNQPSSEYKHKLLPNPEWVVHRNKRANREWQQHTVVWSYDDDIRWDSKQAQALADAGRGRATGNGDFVRSLKLGDVVTLWAKARFGGWANSVKSASLDVYWAV